MVPSHALKKVAFAGFKALVFSRTKQVERRVTIAEIEIESKPGVIGHVDRFGGHHIS